MANKVCSSECALQNSCLSDTSIPCMKKKYTYKKIMKGKRWEYPLPSIRDYWMNIIEEKRRKLVTVRNPFLRLSYDSFPSKYCDSIDCNTFVQNQSFNRKSFSNSYLDDRDTSDNSLHKLHLTKANVKSNRNRFDNVKSLLNSSYRTVPKSVDTMYDSTASFEGVRIPKLNTRDPQPSSGRIHPGKVDHIRPSFNVQNERKKIQENNSTALSILTKYPRMSEFQSTLKKLRKYLKLSKEKDPKTKDQTLCENDKTLKEIRRKLSTDRSTMKRIKENLLPNEDSLKYTARSAYKALKRLSKDKNIDSKLKSVDHLKQGSSLLKSSEEDFLVSSDDNRVLVKSEHIEKDRLNEESFHIFEQKSLEDSEFSGIDDENGTWKSDETRSTESRYASGPSPEFVSSEDNPVARALSSIPKLSFPRRNRDRCLPCMYKSFETPPERKISLPRTVLQRIIDDEKSKATTSVVEDSSEDSDSTSVCTSASMPSLKNEIERILNDRVETRNVGHELESNVPESEVTEDAVSSFQEEGIQKRPEEDAAGQKSIAEPETWRNEITKRGKGDPQHDEATSTNLYEEARIEMNRTRVACLGETKEGRSSLRSEESTEGEEGDDSIAASMIDDDQPKPKYLAPCHAPTNFRPSLEPLRALRGRKPTTLQRRIDLLEASSLRKSGSVDDQVPEKSTPKSVLEKKRRSSDEAAKPAPPRPFARAKSALEKSTPEKAEHGLLRKGTSFSGFPVSTPTPNESEIYRDDASKGTELNETRDDDGLLKKPPLATDLSRAGTKLPLTRPDEIVEILTNLENENVSSTDMLNVLCKEFSERLSKNSETTNDPITRERNRVIMNLTRLLIDSKRYLYPDKFPSDLLFSTDQPPIHSVNIMKRLLPMFTYNKVARLMKLPKWYIREEKPKEKVVEEEIEKIEIESFDSLEVNPPTLKDDEPPYEEKPPIERRYNPYALFLIKPRRKVITWRPLKKEDLEGYDPEATLKMRADNSMKRICQDFCQWVESLGGTDNTIDEEVLRDMFEIDFSADICRTLQVSIKEMPVVPAEVAFTRNSPGASKLIMTKKHVMRDAKAEKTPPKIKAFGTALPLNIRFIPPDNQVHKRWLECEDVPADIETMEAVFKDITTLRSVKGFVEWLQEHPEVPPPEALKKMVAMDPKTLRQIEDDEMFAHLELDIEQIKTLRVAVDEDVPIMM